MRLLVTDRAAHAPRQATAWLIMTFGRKVMNAKFLVNTTFVRSSDKNTVLCGLITSGTVKSGMKVKAEVSPKLYFIADILSVEAINDSTGQSNVGLVLDTPDEDMRYLWKELPAPAEEIDVE